MKTLRNVKVGETATIVRLHGEGALKRRIMDMGLTRGTEVFVRKVSSCFSLSAGTDSRWTRR